MVAFNSKAITWQNRMVEVTEQSLIGAWKWIQNLSCWGSTNTYAAIQHALTDPGTQAIYLLTDGRPDQVHDITSAYSSLIIVLNNNQSIFHVIRLKFKFKLTPSWLR